jgi:EGF-like domain
MRRFAPLLLAFVATVAACSDLYGPSGGDESALPPRASRCAAAGAPLCGAHGTCIEEGEVASCVCEERYVGPTCAQCAAGFQDDDGNGTCEPICGAARCTAHQLCELSSGTPTCVCAPGYEPASGGCAWKGLLRDPAFKNDPAGAWTLEGGASIDPAAAGSVSPGLARISSGSCSTARVSQSFTMPSAADAEPLAFEVASYRVCYRTGNFVPFPCIGTTQLSYGNRLLNIGLVTTVPPPGVPTTVNVKDRLCLGDRAFVPRLELALKPTCGLSTQESGLDDVTIVPAPECPMPGEVPNGGFEGTSGWTGSGAGAEITATGGNNGSRAGHLSTATACVRPTLTGWISPRTSLPRAALIMTVKGTLNAAMNVNLSRGGTVAIVRGTNLFERVAICLPEWSRGLAWPLQLIVNAPGTCSEAITPVDFLFDDLSIATDPSCPEPANVLDGGFESKAPWSAWTGETTFPQNAAQAHAGTGYAVISAGAACAGASMTQLATVPDPKPGAGGPMLRYWYRTTSNGGATTSFSGGGAVLTPAAAWTQSTKCLDPLLAGRPYSLGFVSSGSTNCTSASLFLDDVEIVHDASCPP